MTPAEFQSIQRYVGFDAQDARALSDLLPRAAPHFRRIVDDFYAAIAAHPDASAAITGGVQQVERLKGTLVDWLTRVLSGPHDANYLARHANIGRVHVRIRLPQHFMFTAVNRIRTHLTWIAHEPDLALETQRAMADAIGRVLDLELAVMLDSYRSDLVDQMRAQERLATMNEMAATVAQELIASERRHREVIEGVPAYVLGLDRAGAITLWNRQLELATGFLREEMLGKTPDFAGSHPGGSRLPTKDGSVVYARWRLAELPGTAAGESACYAVGVDITEERALEIRARRAERLAAVGTLAAGLAHEVRNPLNSASLQLEVLARKLRRSPLADELGPTVEVVRGEIQRLDRLVTDFLRFARPAPLRLGPVALNREVSRVVALLEPEAIAGDVRLDLELDESLPNIQGEPERLQQVLLNLMRNVIEALDDSGGRLRVTTAHDEHFVHLRIEDDGPGFPEDAPVFDAFFTTKHQGTGLGLAIVHRIVSDHGGSISVSSKPGRTCFEVRLPNLPPGSDAQHLPLGVG